MSSVRFKRFKRMLSAVVCAVTVCTVCAVATPAPTASAKTVSQYNSELEKAKAKSNELKKQIAALKSQNAPYEKQKAAIEQRIAAVQKEIDLYQSQITTCKATIAKRTKELEEGKEQFKQRLVAMYTAGNTELTVLLSADDYGDYLSKAELVESVSKKDAAMIKDTLAAIEELELSKKSLEDSESEIKNKKAELVEAFNEVNKIVAKNAGKINDLSSDLTDIQQEQKEIEAAIKKAQQASHSGSGSTGGTKINGTGRFTWPVPGYYKVSSAFGSRWGRSHKGIDIIGSHGTVYGATIVAADSGTVILSKYYSGYGNCVMIDHGNGYVTLYGHMKAPSALRVGQGVSKGQVVGYVGATGNVTGPHLHFEIRVNGSATNPMAYFS